MLRVFKFIGGAAAVVIGVCILTPIPSLIPGIIGTVLLIGGFVSCMSAILDKTDDDDDPLNFAATV